MLRSSGGLTQKTLYSEEFDQQQQKPKKTNNEEMHKEIRKILNDTISKIASD